MSVKMAIKKYVEMIKTETFVRYEKDFSHKINDGLSKGYLKKLHEPPLVEIIENVINSINDLTLSDRKTFFELSTKSIFIHGSKSQVEFDYYGQSKQRELGDLIFIISIVFNGRKYFEKLTINQFKKDSTSSGSITWNISNKEQLYLLSRFPPFRGVKGSIIPMKKYFLPNYSGCLGSYGLLFKPGDFAFVSATEFNSFIGDKKSIKINELYDLTYENGKYTFPHFPYFYPYIDELFYLMDKLHRRHFMSHFPFIIFNNYHHAYNTFEFAHKYLTMGIGEPIFMYIGTDNIQARNFLHEMLSALRMKAKREENKKIVNFLNTFSRYGYSIDKEEEISKQGIEFDFKGGGVGIIYTTLNLGE